MMRKKAIAESLYIAKNSQIKSSAEQVGLMPTLKAVLLKLNLVTTLALFRFICLPDLQEKTGKPSSLALWIVLCPIYKHAQKKGP